MQLEMFSLLRGNVGRVLLTIAMAAIALKPRDAGATVRASVIFLGASAILGGVQTLVTESFMGRAPTVLLLSVAMGIGMVLWLFRIRVERVEKWEVEVIVRSSGRQVRFTALIDTGNRLHEPVSGLPVLIVEYAKVAALLPKGFCADVPQTGFRRVAFGGIGGNGHLNVFRPDDVFVNYSDGWMRAPAIWIGVFPGYMPGGACALAPAVLGAIGAGAGGKAEWF